MGKQKAVICGYYGKGNAGDEALLLSLLQMLPEQIEPIVLSGNPTQTSERYQVKSCDRRSLFAILQAIHQADYFIWGGGSLMQDVTSLASPIYYATLMALAQQQGLKTIAWAQGIGPLQTPFTRWLTRQVLQKCTAVTVRDRASAQMMANWQISSLLAPDPVWALTAQSLAEFPLIPTPNIAVNLRSHPQLTASRLETFTQALIEFQEATQAFILLVPFQAEQDLAIAQFLAAQLAENTQIIYLEDPRQLKGLFSQVTLMIGMRLHSLIMAAAAGCLCCAISYDPKVTQLMTELDLSGWELAELPTDAHHIAQTWRKLYSQSQPLNQEQIQSLRDQALGHQQTLTEVMIQR